MDFQTTPQSPAMMAKNIYLGLAPEIQECIHDCLQCHQICEQLIQHCLNAGGKHAEPAHIKILRDCTELTFVTANFLLRNSSFSPAICETCANVCFACAQDCERIADDDRIDLCVDLCRRCADSCTRIAKHH